MGVCTTLEERPVGHFGDAKKGNSTNFNILLSSVPVEDCRTKKRVDTKVKALTWLELALPAI